jgi:hypothetical protein
MKAGFCGNPGRHCDWSSNEKKTAITESSLITAHPEIRNAMYEPPISAALPLSCSPVNFSMPLANLRHLVTLSAGFTS